MCRAPLTSLNETLEQQVARKNVSMRKQAVYASLFCIAVVTEAGLVTFFTFWPIGHDLKKTLSLLGFLGLYSVDSNLDVWVLTVIHVVALPLCFIRVAGQIRRHRRRYSNARMAVSFICITTQVFVLIALFAPAMFSPWLHSYLPIRSAKTSHCLRYAKRYYVACIIATY